MEEIISYSYIQNIPSISVKNIPNISIDSIPNISIDSIPNISIDSIPNLTTYTYNCGYSYSYSYLVHVPTINVNIVRPKNVMFYQTMDGDMTINIGDISFMRLQNMMKHPKITEDSRTALNNNIKYTYTGDNKDSKLTVTGNYIFSDGETKIIKDDIDITKYEGLKKEYYYYKSTEYLTENEDDWIFDLEKVYFEIYMKGNHNGIKVSYRDGLQIQNIMQSERYGLYKDDYAYLTSDQTNFSIPNILDGKFTTLSQLDYANIEKSEDSWTKFDTNNDLALADDKNTYNLETYLSSYEHI